MNWNNFLYGSPATDYIFQEMSYEEQIKLTSTYIKDADYILIGAGAGLSSAAGLMYSGKRFEENFKEFIDKYGMTDMYSAGFYPFPSEEARWGYWSKHSYINRIEPEGLPLYRQLLKIIESKDYFVLTTNVDYQFQKSGFNESRIFATQGDYGLIQCMHGCHNKTYDAIEMFNQMNQAVKDCLVPSYMVPKCPVCGGPMTMNLRCDQYFVEDEKWNIAADNFDKFLKTIKNKKIVLLELGVGFNTPAIIRFPFEKMMRENNHATLVRLNLDEAIVPKSFGKRAVGINEDLNKSISDLLERV